jgi:hypothetical protein
MTTEQSAHLTEEALDDALIGLSSPQAEAHLAVCELCRGQLEGFRSELRIFNQTSLAWSEAKPVKHLPVAAQLKHRPMIPASLRWAALAAAVMLAIGVPVWNHDHFSFPGFGSASRPATQDSEAQIEQDNALLRSVDAALNEPEASPLNEYQLSNGSHPRLKPRPESRNQ